MTRREIREEIFKLLFEHELIDNNIEKRINDVINEENLKKNDEIDFLRSYVTEIIENENILIEKIKNILDGWTYERLGTIEKVLLKISFYEITIKNIGYEIAINEVLEIAKKYSYNDTKEFLNGILAKLVKDIKEEQHK
ncbi:transcription antitermination factor NusB [Leptotrichia buccalis]|jgi:transcription antitermination factor nusB|uniref:Transcription antitermination protein NusB n=1 Tax=Leptotrichia buccalis (strain ATCC 14201 / DSM 1135 / JCM 12969 / NCTC 10249 / C-1013-b) TaxID=523794 RepID=C7NCF2_LEPBD|nr:transcription antitermination factor NusB [Leptotrichia buccalis]ACV39798.1 NusB antitermination factor [Leptotrichia buccalis C-1013-b]